MRRWLAGLLVGGIVLSLAPAAPAADGRKATLTKVVNGVEVRLQGRGAWRKATLRMIVGSGDEVRTGRGASAELTYGDGTVTRVGPGTTMALKNNAAGGRGVKLWFGRLWMRVAKGTGGMNVRTPAAVAAVTGTDLFVFHESKDEKQAASPMRLAAGPGPLFLAQSTSRLSEIGLLEGGVRVKAMTGGFDSANLYNPRAKGLWVASTDLNGFQMAQDFGGQDLNPGDKAVTDGNTFNIVQMSPDEIANNSGVMQNMGNPNPGGGNQGGNNTNSNNNGNKNNNSGGNNSGNTNSNRGNGNQGNGNGNTGSGNQGNTSSNGNAGGTNTGGNQPGGTQPGGTQPGGTQPGGTQPGGTQPGGTQPGGTQPGGTEPGGTQPGGTEPGGTQPGPDPSQTVDPTQTTQQNITTNVVDKSPTTGDLEIIIK